MKREISFSEALCEAQDYCLSTYPEVFLMGLGVPDPKGIFGSTLGLQKKHGPERVFDIPLSENALTGVALGSSITGMRPILTHQRVDFALVSMEQIVNQVAKWHYMFGGKMTVPLVIRMIIGRGWGQGPQHSQSLQVLFAHIPGLKVIMPSNPYDAKGMLIAAIEDDNPIICLEHRWLYSIKDFVPKKGYRVELDKARIVREGTDVSIVSMSYMILECLKAADLLQEQGISAEIIDMRSLQPIDHLTYLDSIEKTGRLIVCDQGHKTYGISAEITAKSSEWLHGRLVAPPVRLGFKNHPTPTSFSLTKDYYTHYMEIVNTVMDMFGKKRFKISYDTMANHDQPDTNFNGPF